MLRVAACSYEGSLFGWDLLPATVGPKHPEPYDAQLHFGFNVAVNSSLKAIAVSKSGKYLATGGMNERIHLFNVAENKGIGEVSGHSGAITALKFFGDSMLLSSSEDGTLFIWRAHDWEHLHILGGHKASVLDFAVHPSGKLALSVSKDHTLKLWNLIQGRCAFTRRLRLPADYVKWHPEGTHYLLCAVKEVQVFAAADNSLTCSYSATARLNMADFVCLSHGDSPTFAIVCVDDNQALLVLTLQGEMQRTVDLSPLGLGRMRSLCVTTFTPAAPPSSSSSSHSAKPVDILTLATSTGRALCLNASCLTSLSEKGASSPKLEGTTLEKARVFFGAALWALHEIGAEPRLTAVTSWVQTGGQSRDSADAVLAMQATRAEEDEAKEEGKKTAQEGKKRVRFPDAGSASSSEASQEARSKKPKVKKGQS